MRVLIVDDSVVMRMIIERGLRQSGMGEAEIVHATDGRDALARLESLEATGTSFDLILTDVNMPVMGGTELLAEARRRGLARGVPVLMITADEADLRQTSTTRASSGRLRRLVKPFTMEQMQACIAPLLHSAAHP